MHRQFLTNSVSATCILLAAALNPAGAEDESLYERSVPKTHVPGLIAHIQDLNFQIRDAHAAGRTGLLQSLLVERIRTAERVLMARATSLEFYLAAKGKIHSLITLAQHDEDQFREAVAFAEKLISHNDIRVQRLGEFNRLGLMLLAIPDASEDHLAQVIHNYREYVRKYQLHHGSLDLGQRLVQRFEEAELGPQAADMYRIMADHTQAHPEYAIRQQTAWFRQRAERVHLIGTRLEIDHTGYFTQRVTNDDYAGRVLLIHFWNSTQYGMRDFAHLKRTLRKHRTNGFEVLGVSMDVDHRVTYKVIRKQIVPWVNLFELDDPQARGFQHPLAEKVEVKQAPTSILLNREGIVVSMNARGEELDRLLQIHLKEPVPVRHITRWKQKGRAFLALDETPQLAQDETPSTDAADTLPDLLKIQAEADARVRATDDVSSAAEE